MLYLDDHIDELVCYRHAGGYLQAAIAARPKAKSHVTPFGKNVLMTAADVADWLQAIDATEACETCRWGAKDGAA